VREQIADGQSRLAVAAKAPGALQPAAVAIGGRIAGIEKWLIVAALELRLGIERIDVRDAAVHEAENDVLGPRPMVRLGEAFVLGSCFLGEHAAEGEPAKAVGGGAEHVAARQRGGRAAGAGGFMLWRCRHGTHFSLSVCFLRTSMPLDQISTVIGRPQGFRFHVSLLTELSRPRSVTRGKPDGHGVFS
jgi:hypothetical protein